LKKPNDELTDLLDELDPPYESLQELRIGRVLDRYGIPFFYKQPTIVYHEGKNEICKPSFTMYSYGGTVIDYINEPEQEELLKKTELYQYNQIPAVVVGPKDMDNPTWNKDLYGKLEQVYRQAFDPMRYEPMDIK
jgi:hypothetical protein